MLGDQPFAASSVLVSGRYGADGIETGRVFDDGIQDLVGEVPPGTAATGEYGLSVPPDATGEVLVQVRPGHQFTPASWKVGVRDAAS